MGPPRLLEDVLLEENEGGKKEPRCLEGWKQGRSPLEVEHPLDEGNWKKCRASFVDRHFFLYFSWRLPFPPSRCWFPLVFPACSYLQVVKITGRFCGAPLRGFEASERRLGGPAAAGALASSGAVVFCEQRWGKVPLRGGTARGKSREASVLSVLFRSDRFPHHTCLAPAVVWLTLGARFALLVPALAWCVRIASS